MNGMSKLLKMLLLPFMMYVGEDAGGGGATDTAGEGGSDSSSVDWGDLNSGVEPGADDEGEEESEVPADSTPPVTSTGTKPEAQADPNATTELDPANPNPEDENLQPPVDSDEQQPLTPEQIAARDTQIAADFAKWQEAETARLAEVYSFDEETAARLQTEPELVLPQVAAKLHIEVMRNALEAVQRMLPTVLPQLLNQQTVEKTAMDTFYGTNPDLKKYHAQVLVAGKMFRKLNPKATPDEAAKKIGDMVRLSLGLEPLKQDGVTPPAATKVAVKPAGRAAPHKPAAAGGGSGVKPAAPAKPADDLWGQMAQDDED